MTEEPADLPVNRCDSCHSRYLPRPGPCPRCGSTDVVTVRIPAVGRVLAATEVVYPPAGWTSPHRIALVAAADDVRILATVDGDLPIANAMVRIGTVGDRFVVRPRDL